MTPDEFFFYDPTAQFTVSEYTERDYDGDTQQDVLAPIVGAGVDAPATGRVTVYSGWLGTMLFEVNGTELDDFFAFSTTGVGDIDGDGLPDLLVGAPGSDIGALDAGRAYLYSGATGALLTTITGSTAGAAFGFVVAPAGDLDGDGLGDLMVSAPFDGAGKVYVFFSSSIAPTGGAFAPNLTPAGADLVFTGEAAGDVFGFSLASAGDVDADGKPDIIIGAPFNDAETGIAGDNRGRVYTYSGETGALLGTVTGNIPAQFLGYSVSSAGDINNDGKADLFMGAPDVPNMLGGGRAFVFYGVSIGAGVGSGAAPFKRICTTADIIFDPSLPGGVPNDSLFGLFVTLGNDVNRDGNDDLIVHAGARNAAGVINDTRAYVFSGADGSFLDTFTATTPLPPPPPPIIPNDGALDQLRTVLGNFGSQNATAADGDLNGDGVVDAFDLIIALDNLNMQASLSPTGGNNAGNEDCLGIVPPNGQPGPCDNPEGSGGGGGGIGPNFDNPNGADEWCHQCDALTLRWPMNGGHRVLPGECPVQRSPVHVQHSIFRAVQA